MKNILIILFISITSCCTSKKNSTVKGVDNEQPQVITDTGVHETFPGCIDKMIALFKSEAVQNPPRKIYRYRYNGRDVYYVTAPCCDFYSDLYDNNCKLIAHPDGGFTGKGDGKAADFVKVRTAEKLVWEDKRK